MALALVAVIILVGFALSLWLVLWRVDKVDDRSHVKMNNIQIYGSILPSQEIELTNKFSFDISIFYDNQYSEIVATHVHFNDKVKATVPIGQGLYATKANGWESIDYVVINKNSKEYEFSPTSTTSLNFRELNSDKRDRIHPAVVFLNQPEKMLPLWFM